MTFLFLTSDGMQKSSPLYLSSGMSLENKFSPRPNIFTVCDATGKRKNSDFSPEIIFQSTSKILQNFVYRTFFDESPQHVMKIVTNLYANNRLSNLFAQELLKVQSPEDCELYASICYYFLYIIEKCQIFSYVPDPLKIIWVNEIGGALCDSEKTYTFLKKYSPPSFDDEAIKKTCLTIKNDYTSNNHVYLSIFVSKEKIQRLLNQISSL
jgi:hypothetical protein